MPRPKTYRDGMKHCPGCNMDLMLINFYPSGNRSYARKCKTCTKAAIAKSPNKNFLQRNTEKWAEARAMHGRGESKAALAQYLNMSLSSIALYMRRGYFAPVETEGIEDPDEEAEQAEDELEEEEHTQTSPREEIHVEYEE